MQLVNFDTTCESIEAVCSEVCHQLRYKKNFPSEKRKEFDQALTNLFYLLHQDTSYFFKERPLWHTAYRIIRLTELNHKIDHILRNIYTLDGPKYFCHKLKRNVLPSLADRIHNLNIFALSNYRFPFSPGVAHVNFFDKAKRQISVINPSNINSIEREFFHLLGNHLRSDQLAEVDLKALSGSMEIYSLLSWANILVAAIQEEKVEKDKQTYQFLLDRIVESFTFATKLSFVVPFVQARKMRMDFPDKAYYEAIVAICADEKVQLQPPKKDFQTFLGQYTLDNVSTVPLKVIENDMAWDMVQTICQMKAGDVRIFLLGNSNHRVTVQVTCTKGGSSDEQPRFKYEIFNTGNGIIPFHRTVKSSSGYFARPLTYLDVPLSAFNFFFCAELIAHSLYSFSIEAFYEKHDFYLVKQGGAKKNTDCGDWYRGQFYGTCCYTAPEAWIDSYLTHRQTKKLELIKTRISTEKQSQIVSLLEGDILKGGSRGAIVQHPLRFYHIVFTDKEKKLKESRLLLALGEERLRHLNKADVLPTLTPPSVM